MPQTTIEGPPLSTRWQIAGGRSLQGSAGMPVLIEAGPSRTADALQSFPDAFFEGDTVEMPAGPDTDHLVASGFLVPPGTAVLRPRDYQTAGDGRQFGNVSVTKHGADRGGPGLVGTVTR